MLLQELTLQNLLSFGPDSLTLPLTPLNLLIGPNGSGKSNLIEAISLLRSAPTKLTSAFRGPGSSSVRDWLWKGQNSTTAKLDAVINRTNQPSIRHILEIQEVASRLQLTNEQIENQAPYHNNPDVFFYYRYLNGRPTLSIKGENSKRQLQQEDVFPDESILSQRKDPQQYPELAYLSHMYEQIRIYREWSFGRQSIFRLPQPSDLRTDRLEEDFSNLGAFINNLKSNPQVKNTILDRMKDLYSGIDDFNISIQGGTVALYLTEGSWSIPASRLSDGTLRYLCLLAILCDPNPPPLICIEEPELGLHPDMIPKLAELLIEASAHTQLIVTTHSDMLVDAMTEQPESVVIFEKVDGKTVSKRIEETADLKEYLEQYRLGEMWLRGLVGGVRW